MQKYFIYLAYDGTNYHGWQIQPNGISVQECLMKALSTFLRHEIEVIESFYPIYLCIIRTNLYIWGTIHIIH